MMGRYKKECLGICIFHSIPFYSAAKKQAETGRESFLREPLRKKAAFGTVPAKTSPDNAACAGCD